jgi:hypothetical protein
MEQALGGEEAPGVYREMQRRRRRERSTYTTPRRYHRGMARQCPRGHDDIEPGEVTDETSTKHPAHQAQISP